jgi:hypothetical protein
MTNYAEDGWCVSEMPDKGGIFHKWKTIAIPAVINKMGDNQKGAERRWPCGLILRVTLDAIKAHKPGPMFASSGKQSSALFHHVPVNKFYLHAGDPSWLIEKGYTLKEDNQG